MTTVNVNEWDSQLINNYIHFLNTRFGIKVHSHQIESLKQAVINCCKKFSYTSPAKFLANITTGTDSSELVCFIKDIVVDESYFFRDEKQNEFLRDKFLPDLIERKRQLGDKSIRIWSAGCSRGQEIYSVCILLHQLLDDFTSWNLQLVGTDVSRSALACALEAKYNKWSIRTEEEFIETSGYFERIDNNCFQVMPEIRKKVQFYYLNLIDNSYPSIMNGTYNVDLILCRNVFIYFNQDVIEHACRKFSQALAKDGILMLSATDPVNFPNAPLKLEIFGDVHFFKASSLLPDSAPATKQHTYLTPETIKPAGKSSGQSDTNDLNQNKQNIILALQTGNWEQVLATCEQLRVESPDDSEVFQFQAKALLNLGRLKEAKRACEKSIQLDPLEPHSYLLLGIIELQQGAHNDAEAALKKTIFLNAEFMEAHYQLGQIMLYKGDNQQAMKYIKNALKLAQQGNPSRPVHNVFSLTYAGFAEMLKNELLVHQQR